MENNLDKKEFVSFEKKIVIGVVILDTLAFLGFFTSSLPETERIGATVLFLAIAQLIYIFRKQIAQFALAEKRFWEMPIAERWRKWRQKHRRS